MNKKRSSEPLHITFHNPNTQEETVRELVHIAAQMAKTRVEAHLLSLMGRDPVEHASVRNKQPPAMRVRVGGYTKKSPFELQ